MPVLYYGQNCRKKNVVLPFKEHAYMKILSFWVSITFYGAVATCSQDTPISQSQSSWGAKMTPSYTQILGLSYCISF